MGSDNPLTPLDDFVVLFDGYCNLCSGAVQFIIKRDKKKKFRFASLQSQVGSAILKKYGLAAVKADSVVLILHGRAYTESTAALLIALHLSVPWPLLYVFIIVPSFLRNAVYRFIARNRYRWFGRFEECWLPDEELRQRFLDL